jgi:hypothetical protein
LADAAREPTRTINAIIVKVCFFMVSPSSVKAVIRFLPG